MVLDYLRETLQDNYHQLEDRYLRLRSEFKDKSRLCELLRREHDLIQRDLVAFKENLRQKSHLIQQNGLSICTFAPLLDAQTNGILNSGQNKRKVDKTTNGLSQDTPNGLTFDLRMNGMKNGNRLNTGCDEPIDIHLVNTKQTALLFSTEMSAFLQRIEGESLNDKIRNLLHDKHEKREKVKCLRSNLDDEKIRNIKLEGLSLLNHKHHLGEERQKSLNQCEYSLYFGMCKSL